MTPIPRPANARWVEFQPGSRSRSIPLSGSTARSFCERELSSLGLDFLSGHFRAGTPNSTTHLAWFLVAGRVSLVSDGRVMSLRPGQMAFSPAGHPHWIITRHGSGSVRGAWFHLRDSAHWQKLRAMQPLIRDSSEGETLFQLLGGFLRERESESPVSLSLCRSYGESAMLVLQRELDGLQQSGHEAEWARNLEVLWSEVDAALQQPWSTEQLAQRLGVSTGYFHRLCIARHGCGPMERVRAMRMNHAMMLLLRTQLTLSTIAESVGYSNAYGFSKAFLAIVGVRPGTFRSRSV